MGLFTTGYSRTFNMLILYIQRRETKEACVFRVSINSPLGRLIGKYWFIQLNFGVKNPLSVSTSILVACSPCEVFFFPLIINRAMQKYYNRQLHHSLYHHDRGFIFLFLINALFHMQCLLLGCPCPGGSHLAISEHSFAWEAQMASSG